MLNDDNIDDLMLNKAKQCHMKLWGKSEANSLPVNDIPQIQIMLI